MLRNFIKKNHILYIVGFSLIFTLFSATFVSALTYQQEIGVNFTFNPALNLTVSADLYINNLAPGAASDSNVIDVVVATNAINGYTLTANVGNNTTYNTRNLVHSNSNLSNTFTSIAYSATPTITTNTNLSADTWGFSYSTNNGSTWSNYNGLPLYSDTTNVATLKETTGPVSSASGDDVKFKIAAKASASQVSGAYNNVINFNLAANVVPQYTVQFNAGDGSGTMPSQTIFRDEATMLAPNSFTPPSGFVFTGWNTAADGSGTSYTNQESVTNIAADGGTITLYAQWGAKLYDIVASMSKGKQTLADIRESIETPTSSNPRSSNSGVYEYDASVFGTSSDASNDYTIYYYRGILDSYNNTGTKGRDGLADVYPNYVKLANDTCWRIVRTTGSGGVKMIYNGVWGASNTCATTLPQIGSSTFYNRATPNDSSNDYGTRGFAVYVGYNYNPTYGYNNTNLTTAVNNDLLFSNNTASNIKTRLESWYATTMTDYTSILESSAGYCNDRSTHDSSGNITTSTIPYATSGIVRFGAYLRNTQSNSHPSLNCPNTTGNDLLTTSNGLSYPASLLTVDEMTLAGSGDTYVYPVHTNSFLCSGSAIWSLSPRSKVSSVEVFFLSSANCGTNSSNSVYDSNFGIQPVVSLKPGTTAVSGSGTATDPWVVAAPPKKNISNSTNLQEVNECPSTLTTGQTYTLTDSRDGTSYSVAKLADGKCWMLDNLMLDIADSNVQAHLNEETTNASNTTLQHLLGTVTPRDANNDPNGKYPTAAVGYVDNYRYYSVPKVAVGGACNDSTYCANSPTSGNWTSSAILQNLGYDISGRVGAYYNYCAASAGSYCYGNGTLDTGSPSSDPDPNSLQDIKEDICPRGWRLPTGSGYGEYTNLYGQYTNESPNQTTAFLNAYHGLFSGNIYQGKAYAQGSDGKYYTSTWTNTYNMYQLSIDVQGYVFAGDVSSRPETISVRCILNTQ